MPAVPSDPILARAIARKGVEGAAREVLELFDRVGWPIVMNGAVERLRAAVDRAAGARRAATGGSVSKDLHDRPILARAIDRKGVEGAAREVLKLLDRVGWPIVMNGAVERLRATLDRAAGARRAK